jgi:hypothetical protein
MALSRRSIETLVDLVEIKLSMLEVFDREDRLQQKLLEETLRELSGMLATSGARPLAAATLH